MTKAEMKEKAKTVVTTIKDIAEEGTAQVEAAADEAQKLADTSAKVFEDTAAALKAGTSEWQLKIFDIAKSNLDAGFDFAQKMIEAKTPAEALKLQGEFAQRQFAVMHEQTTALHALATKVAEDSAKPVQAGMLKSFEEARKAFTA